MNTPTNSEALPRTTCYPSFEIMNDEKQLIREGNELRCALQHMKASRNKWRACCEATIITLIILTLIHFFG